MSDFEDMAGRLRDDLDSKQKAHQERLKSEHNARMDAWGRGQAFLEAHVLPIFNEAKAAFEQQITVEIDNNWKRELHMRPEVSLSVSGAKKRPHDDSTYNVDGPRVVAAHDGEKLSVYLTKTYNMSEAEKNYKGSDPDAVRQAIKIAVASLYSQLDPNR